MKSYSGWEGYYKSSNSQSLWKEEVEPFLVENAEVLFANNEELKVLDVACGDGRNTQFFYRHSIIVYCVNISKTALKKLGEKFPQTNRICEDFIKSNLNTEQFDIVICFDGLAQMEHPALALNKMISLTKPNGLIVYNFFTKNDCAYGEGEKIDNSTYSFKDTIFKFYTFEESESMIPSNVDIIKKTIRKWSDPPHGGFRPYPHQHEAAFFILRKL